MINMVARNVLIIMRCKLLSSKIDGERSLSTLVTKTHDCVVCFLTNYLLRYKCIENKLKFYQMTSGKLLHNIK